MRHPRDGDTYWHRGMQMKSRGGGRLVMLPNNFRDRNWSRKNRDLNWSRKNRAALKAKEEAAAALSAANGWPLVEAHCHPTKPFFYRVVRIEGDQLVLPGNMWKYLAILEGCRCCFPFTTPLYCGKRWLRFKPKLPVGRAGGCSRCIEP
jgi:hypothetical protein